MAQPTNLHDSYDLTTAREDYSDIISNVMPEQTPFLSMIGETTATNTLHQWNTDTFAPVDTNNARVEGDDASIQALTAPVRVDNVTQISDKAFAVSGTTRAIDVAGAQDEYDRQAIKKGIELKRDMEAILVRNQAKDAGSNGSPTRKLRSMEAFIATNVSRGTGGANGSATTAATDGTTRSFAESLLTTVAENLKVNSGEFPTLMMVHPTRRKDVSGLSLSGVTRFETRTNGRLSKSVRIVETDFGDLELMDNIHMRTRTMALINPDLWNVAYLTGRKYVSYDLAKTGDNTKHQMLSEYTLECINEAGNGVIVDIA